MNPNEFPAATLDPPRQPRELESELQLGHSRILSKPPPRFAVTAVYNAVAERMIRSQHKPVVRSVVTERRRQEPYAYD